MPASDRVCLGYDEDTQRAYEIGDDAYLVFRKRLESGHPPDDWKQLLTERKMEAKQNWHKTAPPSGILSHVRQS